MKCWLENAVLTAIGAASAVAVIDLVGGFGTFGSWGEKEVYRFMNQGMKMAVVEQDLRFTRFDRYDIHLDGKRIDQREMIDDDGRKVVVSWSRAGYSVDGKAGQ